MTNAKEPYNLDPGFERMVLTLSACSPRFYGRLGYALDAECCELPEAKLILDAVRQIARELGHGPESVLLVLQRLRRRMTEGKVTLEQVQAVAGLFDLAEDDGLQDENDVVTELTPVIRRRMEHDALITGLDNFAGRRGFENVVDLFARAKRLGQVNTSAGTRLDIAGFEEIERNKTLTRLPSGVLELDLQLDDGLPRGAIGVAIGDTGGGKSMYLVHQACEALRRRVHTVYATLELPKPVQLARLYANLTGIPINQILESPADMREARRRMEVMVPNIGACMVEEFTPHATTVADIKDWVARCEDTLGEKVGCVIVDYADKMHDPKVKGDNDYVAMRNVYEGLRRDIAVASQVWVWTASQASRPSKESAKRIDIQNVADSMHKVRTSDLVLTLNFREDGEQMMFFVAKNRHGKGRFQVGPVPTDFARARIVPLASEGGPWLPT